MSCAILMPSKSRVAERPALLGMRQGKLCNGYENRGSSRQDALF